MPVRIPLLETVQPSNYVSQANSSAATAPIRAMGQAADSAGNAMFGALGMIEEIQAVKNQGKVDDLKTQAREAAMAYDATLATNKDPATWGTGFEKAMTDFENGAAIQNLAPDAQRSYKQWSGQFKSTQGLKYSQQGNMFAIEQAKVAKDNSVQKAMDMEDWDGAIREVQSDALLSPAEKEAGVYKINNRRAKSDLEQDIIADPQATLKELESEDWVKNTPGATGELRRWGIHQAEIGYQRAQKEAIGSVTSDIQIGNIATEQQLTERLKKDKNISPEMHDEILFHFKQSKPLDAETRFALTDGLNGLHDSYTKGDITLEEYRTAHDGVAQVIYSFGTRDGSGELRQRMNNLDPTNWGPRKQPADTRIQTIEKLGSLFEQSGAFGKVSDEDIEKMSPMDVASKRTDIFNSREAVEKEMKSWLLTEEGQKADQESVSNKFKQTFLNVAASKILRPGGAQATQTEVEDYIRQNSGGSDDPKGASSQIKVEPVGDDLTSMVKHFEAGGEKSGFHAKAYWDYGQWSIGYGTKSREGEVIDQSEAEKRLQDELAVHKKRVVSTVSQLKLEMSPHQIDALTSFDYNTGSINKLLAGGTRSNDEIASAMLLYANADGKKLPGLLNRRKSESYLFRNGYKGARDQAKADPTPDESPNTAPDPTLNRGELSPYNVVQ